jgi:hypothetical protein
MAKEVPYDAIKARAAKIFAAIKKSQTDENDPAANLTVEDVVLMLVHSHRENKIEVKFGSLTTPPTTDDIDLNFVNGNKKADLAKTKVLH